MEQLNYNLLFRWFVGLNPDDAVWVLSERFLFVALSTPRRDTRRGCSIARAFSFG